MLKYLDFNAYVCYNGIILLNRVIEELFNMKKAILNFVAAILLSLGGLFAFPALSNPTYALPDDNSTEDNSESTDRTDLNSPDSIKTKSPNHPNSNRPMNLPGSTDSEDNGEDPDSTTDTDNNEETTDPTDSEDPETNNANSCKEAAGGLYWIVCPTIDLVAKASDALYGIINDFLVVEPLRMEDSSPIYLIWKYMRALTNIVFIIFLLIVIYSQITGLGINNYGVKRVLPRLIIAVIMVNLSFLICALLTDISNLTGAGLRSIFSGIQESISAQGNITSSVDTVSFSSILTVLLGGGTIAGVAIGATGGIVALFWALIPILLSALVAIVSGLITIAARQAVITVLVMIAPLAFLVYLLPNTERWFAQWKNMFLRMLIFYPAFSFLFGASQLAGWAIIASATSAPMILLGVAVQIFPLFGSWSLMKISGTILNQLNSAIRKVAAPTQKLASGWALEHADERRQNYWLHSNAPGARLRGYLDYRRSLRLLDATNASKARENRALHRAYTKSASITGRDEKGNMTWEKNPNRYTRTAKSASYYATLAETAQLAHKNTITAYGRHFADNNNAAKELNNAGAQAFLDLTSQQFLATNEAQADQEWLLNQFLQAKGNLNTNSYQYNRLIKGAAGGLGHNGESSIMGQVIIGNSNIENRRRTEGRIMINKFGMEKHKGELRGMIFDINKINDEGFATDEFGNVIEDDQYRLLEGKQYTSWQRYIGVHKQTGKEITKEEYDGLSDSERSNYKKVRYFDITDDHGVEVQRIFEDDAGYMKEILADDVYISDPIVRRFSTQIGVAKNDDENDGILRRYHSTIRSAMDGSGFSKGHGAGYTQMYTSAANAGLIRSMGHHNIMLLQSFAASVKPGGFFQQDGFFIDELDKLLQTAAHPENFSHYFPDEDIITATTNNGVPINGMRLVTDENNQLKWEEVNYSELAKLDPATALEYRKNYIKHKMIPKAISVATGFLERRLSPEAVNALKPGAKKKLDAMREHLSNISILNLDENIPFTERPDGSTNLVEVADTNSMSEGIKATQRYIEQAYQVQSNVRPNEKVVQHSANQAIQKLQGQLQRSHEADTRVQRMNDMTKILQELDDYRINAINGLGLEVFCMDVLSLFEDRTCLNSYYSQCEEAISQYRYASNYDPSKRKEFEDEQIENVYKVAKELVYQATNETY